MPVRVPHLSAHAEVWTPSLHAVFYDKEAGQLGNEVPIALQEVGWRSQVGVQLQAPVALVGLLEVRQLAQAVMHLRAPAWQQPDILMLYHSLYSIIAAGWESGRVAAAGIAFELLGFLGFWQPAQPLA